MIKLTNSIDFIILTNSASGSIDWTINWRDEIEDNIEPGSASGHISTATTTVLVPAIALAVHRVEDRVIEGIVITNKGVGSQNIQLFKSSAGGTTYALCELYALGAGQSLRITEAGQFLNNALTPSSSVGPQGPAGAAGANGKTVLNGAVDPTTEGVDGDFYINTVSNTVFGPKATTWPAGVALVGPAGANGHTVLNGAVDPTTEGVNGDFYINTASNKVFGPKAGGTWPAGVSLVGPTGSTGAAGLTILNGAVDPTTEGVNGDFYINTVSNKIFGPKATGTWPAGVSLVGPAGSNGTNGTSVLTGAITPTTEGANGDIYLEVTAGNLTVYGPKAAGVWPAGVVIVST